MERRRMAQARQDFRVHFGMPRHVKTRRLIRRIGPAGAWGLICLWAYVGENHPSGRIGDVSDDTIEEFADWNGEPGAFAGAMWELGWLERQGARGVSVRDWPEHQEFLYTRSARQRASKKANKAKRDKQLGRHRSGTDPVTEGLTDPVTGFVPETTESDTPSSSSSSASNSSSSSSSSPPGIEEEEARLDLIRSLGEATRWHGSASLLGVVVADLEAAGIDLDWVREWLADPVVRRDVVGMLPYSVRNRILETGSLRADADPQPLVCSACLAHGGALDELTNQRSVYFAHVGPGTDRPAECGVPLCLPHQRAYGEDAQSPAWAPDPLPPPPEEPPR